MIFLISNQNICSGEEFFNRVKNAILANVDYIVIRDKELSDFEYKKIVNKIMSFNLINTKIIISHRNNLYKEYSGIYLHNSLNDINKDTFSTSVHKVEEIKKLKNSNIKYGFISHIFKTDCKNSKPKGIEFLISGLELSKKYEIELIALGGINKETIKELHKISIKNIGIMSEWLLVDDVYDLIMSYKENGY